MIDLLFAAGTGAATLFGYLKSRQFVRHRLRFVDAAQKPSAAVIAGVGAALVAAPVVWLLPVALLDAVIEGKAARKEEEPEEELVAIPSAVRPS